MRCGRTVFIDNSLELILKNAQHFPEPLETDISCLLLNLPLPHSARFFHQGRAVAGVQMKCHYAAKQLKRVIKLTKQVKNMLDCYQFSCSWYMNAPFHLEMCHIHLVFVHDCMRFKSAWEMGEVPLASQNLFILTKFTAFRCVNLFGAEHCSDLAPLSVMAVKRSTISVATR